MKKHLPVYVYGAIIILSGTFLYFSNGRDFNALKLSIGIASMIGALFAYISAGAIGKKEIQFTYHEMHALIMLVYSIAILVFCDTPEALISITSFLLVFYSFSEIIFCNWLFNQKNKVIYKIIAIRALLGLAIGIGTVIAMNASMKTLEIFGVLFILVGVNVLLYAPVMNIKSKAELPDLSS